MICKKCKTENDASSKFCKNCGCELVKEDIEIVDATSKVSKKPQLALIFNNTFNNVKEHIRKINVKQMFGNNNLFKKSIFFRTKKNFIVTVVLLLLILSIVALWKSGVVFDKIANNVYNSYKGETITYDQAVETLSKLGVFSDVSSIRNDCEDLRNSRESYDKGISYLNEKNHKAAMTEFKNVIKTDDNYKDAQEKIKECRLQLSREFYEMAVSYENSSDWFNAFDNYSNVIVGDDNYALAQTKKDGLKKKIHDSTIEKLREYKASNDYDRALELISKTVKYTYSNTLQEYNEYFNTQKKIADVVSFEYDHGPFTLYQRYSSGEVMHTTYIETFNIVDAKIAYNGDIQIKCDITGISDWEYCSFDIKCYNEKGFITDSVPVTGAVASNEPFKITDDIFIPADTVRIKYVAD